MHQNIPHAVMALAFSSDLSKVTLMYKHRPSYLADKWNAIGGKVEPGETPLAACQREFREEAGVDVSADRWVLIGHLLVSDTEYIAVYAVQLHATESPVACTDEPIGEFSPYSVRLLKATPSLQTWVAAADSALRRIGAGRGTQIPLITLDCVGVPDA